MTLSATSQTYLAQAEQEASGLANTINAIGSAVTRRLSVTADPRNPFLAAAPTNPADRRRYDFYHQKWLPFVDGFTKFRAALHDAVVAISDDRDADRLKNALKTYRATMSSLQQEIFALEDTMPTAAATPPPVAPSPSPSPSRPRAAAPSYASAIPPAVQADLWRETNARFWAQTGYKPNVNLDPKNPADAAMMPTYMGVYKTVLGAWQRGELANPDAPGWTFKHPQVAASLAAAGASSANTAAAIAASQAATKAGDHDAAAQHLANANAEHAMTVQQVSAAASVQPRSVSAYHVQQAVHRILHFHMNAAGVGELDPADAAAAMQATSAPVLASANDTPHAVVDADLGQAMSPEIRGAGRAWHATPTWMKVGLGVGGAAVAAFAFARHR